MKIGEHMKFPDKLEFAVHSFVFSREIYITAIAAISISSWDEDRHKAQRFAGHCPDHSYALPLHLRNSQ